MRRIFVSSFWLIGIAMLPGTPPAEAEPAARPVVLSTAPDKVAVTLYRDPERGTRPLDRNAPTSFALIVETRTIVLPPGEAVVRFEGVASGIVPQSAILFGTDPRERNRDAALLSQKGLVDSFTGQRVVLRRTNPATGKTVEEPATIRSSADRLVATTPRGVEAIYCTGLNQTLIYPEAPATLSAKPVLSMTTRDQRGGTATVTLAYLATGFDWDATYVATLSPEGDSLSLLGWLTMASADDTSFAEADTSAVAGKINKSHETRDDTGLRALEEARYLNRSFRCWPTDTTSDLPFEALPPPPPAGMMEMAFAPSEMVVTARRSEMLQDVPMAITVIAQAESLGDLKLYRIPEPVTVAARSQKQVAFMVKDKVKGELVYRASTRDGRIYDPEIMFRFQNKVSSGMGDPLPAGNVIFYQPGPFGQALVGQADIEDKALDEEVELVVGLAKNVSVDVDAAPETKGGKRRFDVTVSNANPFPIRFEQDFPFRPDETYRPPPGKLVRKPAKRIWTTIIPAHDSMRFTYYSIRTRR